MPVAVEPWIVIICLSLELPFAKLHILYHFVTSIYEEFTKNLHPAQEIQYCGGWGYGRHSKAAIELIKAKCPGKDWFCKILQASARIHLRSMQFHSKSKLFTAAQGAQYVVSRCIKLYLCPIDTCHILSLHLATLSFTLRCFIVASWSTLDGLDPYDLICIDVLIIFQVCDLAIISDRTLASLRSRTLVSLETSRLKVNGALVHSKKTAGALLKGQQGIACHIHPHSGLTSASWIQNKQMIIPGFLISASLLLRMIFIATWASHW